VFGFRPKYGTSTVKSDPDPASWKRNAIIQGLFKLNSLHFLFKIKRLYWYEYIDKDLRKFVNSQRIRTVSRFEQDPDPTLSKNLIRICDTDIGNLDLDPISRIQICIDTEVMDPTRNFQVITDPDQTTKFRYEWIRICKTDYFQYGTDPIQESKINPDLNK